MQHQRREQNLLPQVNINIFFFAALGFVLGALFYFYPLEDFVKYLGAGAAAAAVLYRPLWGFYLLAAVLPFVPDLSLLLFAIVIVSAFLLHRLRGGGLGLDAEIFHPGLLLFTAAVAVFTLVSVHPEGSFRDFSIYIAALALLFVMVSTLNHREQLYRFLLVALLAAAVVSLYGVYQYIAGVEMGGTWVDEEMNPFLTTRAFSFFGNPNILSMYLVGLLSFPLALGLSTLNLWKKFMFYALTGLMLLTLVLTFSRAGWMGGAAAVLIFTLIKEKKLIFLCLGLAAVGLLLMPDVVYLRLYSAFSLQDTSNIYRLIIWREGWEMLRDFWFTGIGLGHEVFTELYPFYMFTRDKAPFHLHSTYLQLLVEVGVVGFLLFGWMIIGTLKKAYSCLSRSRDVLVHNVLLASTAGLGGLLVQGLWDNVLYMTKIILLFFLLLALIFLCAKITRTQES